jgi:hypothetical protein
MWKLGIALVFTSAFSISGIAAAYGVYGYSHGGYYPQFYYYAPSYNFQIYNNYNYYSPRNTPRYYGSYPYSHPYYWDSGCGSVPRTPAIRRKTDTSHFIPPSSSFLAPKFSDRHLDAPKFSDRHLNAPKFSDRSLGSP